jgi:hypothetical protein
MSEVASDTATENTELESGQQGRNTASHSIEFAASKLRGESPEDNLPEEPEDTAEDPQEETVEEESEAEEADDEESEEEEEESQVSEDEVTDEEEELYYSIKVDGEELEVTLDELRSGYQRQKDYTKKTQSLAEQRKEFEDKSVELDGLYKNFENQAVLATEVLNRDLKKFATLDWDKLKTEDPVEYVSKQLEVQDINNQKKALQDQLQLAFEQQQKASNDNMQKYLTAERKELEKLLPDWKDPKKAAVAQEALTNYGREIGYTDQELASIVRAKDLLILDKARRYDELSAKKESISKKKTAPAIRKRVKSKGVAPKGVNKVKAVESKRDNLRKSGSLKDAAALMQEMRSSKVIEKTRS